MIVYFVKIATNFTKEYLAAIKIDDVLEAEFCIIFHAVIIGIQCGTKTFNLLKKIYLKKSKRNHKESAKSLRYSKEKTILKSGEKKFRK
jgi:hypothetical protein